MRPSQAVSCRQLRQGTCTILKVERGLQNRARVEFEAKELELAGLDTRRATRYPDVLFCPCHQETACSIPACRFEKCDKRK